MDWISLGTVAFVCLLIFVLALSYTSLYFPALYHENNITFWILAPSCMLSLMLGAYSYFRAVWIAPGYPYANTKSYFSNQQLDDMKRRHQQQVEYKKLLKQKKVTTQIRRRQINNLTQNSYCVKCNNAKLSRTHHCKVCKHCIQRMDHHCPWVGNCVGKHNHKYFLLFLFYITIALLIVSISIIVDFINPEQPILSRIYQIDELFYIITLLTGGMCILLMFSIGFLLVSQLMLIAHNLTTLQSFYDGIYQNVIFGIKKNPFKKQSITQHMKQIMGESWWFLPTKPFPGNKTDINVAFTQQ